PDREVPEAEPEHDEVEEVAQRLRSEVVLADPVRREEEPRPEPREPSVRGERLRDEQDPGREGELEEDGRPVGDADGVVPTAELRDERREREEARPVVVGGEEGDV